MRDCINTPWLTVNVRLASYAIIEFKALSASWYHGSNKNKNIYKFRLFIWLYILYVYKYYFPFVLRDLLYVIKKKTLKIACLYSNIDRHMLNNKIWWKSKEKVSYFTHAKNTRWYTVYITVNVRNRYTCIFK